jgi:tetratricopeptide (TPR) repeat protein
LTLELSEDLKETVRQSLRDALAQEASKTGSRPDSQFSRIAAWKMAVDAHLPGLADDAAVKIGGWSGDNLESVFAFLKEVTGQPFERLKQMPAVAGKSIPDLLAIRNKEDINAMLKRAALLHSDIALLNLETAPGSPMDSQYALTKDGRSILKIEGQHLKYARRLLDLISPNPSADEMVRQWYIATTAHSLTFGHQLNAERNLGRALVLFPSDPVILFYAGLLHEAQGSPAAQNTIPPPGTAFAYGSKKSELKLARRFFQLAVAADPEFAEARLHLGRVRGLEGDHRQALVELRQAAAGMKDPQLQFYAAIFSGYEETMLGDKTGAREQLERAAALYPNAQSPLLMLSWLARSNGDAQVAARDVERVFALEVEDSVPEDPWWDYNTDSFRNADKLMAAMIKTFGGLLR